MFCGLGEFVGDDMSQIPNSDPNNIVANCKYDRIEHRSSILLIEASIFIPLNPSCCRIRTEASLARIYVERKAIPDLVQSVFDTRLGVVL